VEQRTIVPEGVRQGFARIFSPASGSRAAEPKEFLQCYRDQHDDRGRRAIPLVIIGRERARKAFVAIEDGIREST
jgi:hypothetical protein